MHKDIIAAQKAVEIGKENLKKAVKKIQSRCKHLQVIMTPHYYYQYIGGGELERRICENCGYEEEDWTFAEYSNKKLKDAPNRFLKKVDRHNFYKYRPIRG